MKNAELQKQVDSLRKARSRRIPVSSLAQMRRLQMQGIDAARIKVQEPFAQDSRFFDDEGFSLKDRD